MFPGMGRINPKQMAQMMRQMGIKTEELEAERVIFELKGKKLVIENPNVTAMDIQGQKTYTVMGTAKEESKGFPEEDIEMVAEQANVSKEKAKKALEKNDGDIAAAIASLKK
ncbi:MAG: nascent polypeptide-associated complex protein [Candidatus Diapherotrites archaeon]|uniref:Nascent polypeptide-associated complex protein n=1 Tax=Candidatus Iainarchaeum sp. TaxID=3101447 RepID=A0A8T4KZ34_9ARCH|nr:nascent polypeptide-associated complex protein [Candidatus Diapherotrites archaeon]